MGNSVSIITPTWNCAKYIADTICSVQNQTFQDWELLIVDDSSSDNTCEIVASIAENDARIRLIKQSKNMGAAVARNRGLENARGRFIAYLDADDIWLPDKLEHQVAFMMSNNYAFTCTSYEVIDGEGKVLNKQVHMLPSVSYTDFLKNNFLQTVGIMADTNYIEKKYLIMPNIRRRQDAATWLQILKAGFNCYGLDEILAQYRRTENSLSSNKLKAAKDVWHLYRNIEHLSFLFSCYCFARYAVLAVWKRIYV